MGAGASVNAIIGDTKMTIGQEITAATILLRQASDLPRVLIEKIMQIVADASMRTLRLDIIDGDGRPTDWQRTEPIGRGRYDLYYTDDDENNFTFEWGYLQ